MLPRPSHYEMLGIESTADFIQIKSAYSQLSRIWHSSMATKFSWLQTLSEIQKKHAHAVLERINKAYEILSDPEKRAAYDMLVKIAAKKAPNVEDDAFIKHWEALKDHRDMFLMNVSLEENRDAFLEKILNERKESKRLQAELHEKKMELERLQLELAGQKKLTVTQEKPPEDSSSTSTPKPSQLAETPTLPDFTRPLFPSAQAQKKLRLDGLIEIRIDVYHNDSKIIYASPILIFSDAALAEKAKTSFNKNTHNLAIRGPQIMSKRIECVVDFSKWTDSPECQEARHNAGHVLLREFEKHVDTTSARKYYWDADSSHFIREMTDADLKPSSFSTHRKDF